MTKHRLFGNKGFTLVEAMIILMVIGVLASIIYVGFNGYRENVLKTQIATATEAFQSSLKTYAQEKERFPLVSTCLPLDTKCCSSTASTPTTVYCGTDVELGWDILSEAAAVNKYINNQPPTLPVVPTFTNCVAGIMSNGPCKSNGSIKTGFTYVVNIPGSIYTSTNSSVKAMLVYYVGPTYTCNSRDVMTLSGSNLSINSSAQYSRSTADYRECIIAIKPA